MNRCDSCDRHLLPGTRLCPFCSTGKVAKLAGAIAMPAVLSACYGQPPCDQTADADGDGFETCLDWGWFPGPEDCDDADPAVNPDAQESCDNDIDDNCDGIIAGTETVENCFNESDDDCDGLLPADDPDCEPADSGDSGDTGQTGTTGTVAISYTLSAAGSTIDCAAAGLGEDDLMVTLAIGGTPQDTLALDCDDTAITLDDVPAGAQSVTITAASDDTIREWATGTVSVEVIADTSTPLDVVLTCSSPGVDDGCGGG